MITVEVFEAEHLARMEVQAVQAELAGDRWAMAQMLAATGRCFTIRAKADGHILFCGGALQMHAHHATLWSALSPQAADYGKPITRRVLAYIGKLEHRRVDAVVRLYHDAAHRWMAALGFRPESTLGDYFENGEDAMIYRLVR
ncbi:hypothetical protein [Stakelama pacifica]|uniref:Acetyltransferase (GNAT) family protein n=1 Tax=Stakelama pacifica TaxID=517720 RepID=A0A4R6FN11_9SPHN|nr:hypothetical protein [Stakelama pacifica]TDN82972.1 hypothetical protein EV664_105170 [Stakelama pacifica]GGO95039.1 hypothetical protein GCM10011329_18280 [Stakelama pacifica]